MSGYRINHGKVISQAEEIHTLSDELAWEISNLENLLGKLKSDWSGPASEEFQNQLLMLIADMKATKHDMTNVSDCIKNAANQIQREDENVTSSN